VDEPPELAPLVKNLLRRVAIVPDLATGLKLKQSARNLAFATLTGEFISSEGIIFGGAVNTATDSMLGRKAIIIGLEQEAQVLETERAGAVLARDQAKEQVQSSEAAVAEARRGHESAHEKSSQTGVEILSAERTVADEERRLAQIETEKGTLDQQVRSADDRIAEIARELQSDRHNLENEQGLQAGAEKARENARLREEEAAEKLNELRLAVATERQRHESLVHHREPMAAREAELADLVAARRGDIATYQDRLGRRRASLSKPTPGSRSTTRSWSWPSKMRRRSRNNEARVSPL
jgi:chromosome segregation ATPase